jgi:CBS domain-containing protein
MPLKDNLRRDTVELLDLRPAVCVRPTDSIDSAVRRMQSQRTGCLFVEEAGGLAGIFTERDLLARVLANGVAATSAIKTVMTPNPAMVRRDDSIGSVLKKLRDGGYRHLPVLDNRGRLVGRLTVRELVHYMVEHFPKAVYNLPPKSDQVHVAPDGA